MSRRRASLGVITLVAAAGISAVQASAAREDSGSAPLPQFFGVAGGWSYRGDPASPSASTLLLASDATGVVLLFCEGGRVSFHLSLGTTDRRALTGTEDGLLQVYALVESGLALPEDGAGQGAQDRLTPDQAAGDHGARYLDASDQAGDHAPPAEVEQPASALPLAQFQVRFFSDSEFRSVPLRQPGWDTPDRLLDIIKGRPEGLRLVVARLRQTQFTSARMADLYLPGGTDGSGLAMDDVLARLKGDCRNRPAQAVSGTESVPAR